MNLKQELEKTLELLLANTRSLAELAKISGRDTLTFYQGADLSDLDLSGQDLRGLNFEAADLLGSNLSGISFDKGAFNGSLISEEYDAIKDDFDSYIEDAADRRVSNGIYVFVSFREETLEQTIDRAQLTYEKLANLSGVSTATIRKARRSGVVAIDTAAALSVSILERIGQLRGNASQHQQRALVAQPMIQFLELRHGGSFKHIPRARILELAQMADRIDTVRYPEGKPYKWRHGPQILEWLDKNTLEYGPTYYPRGIIEHLPLLDE